MTHLPRKKAAQMLELCPTTFKKVCRRAGPVHAIHEGCPSSPVFSAAVDFSMATSNNLQQPGAATVQEGDSYAGALLRDSETASKVHRVAMPKPSAEQSYNVVDAVMDYLDTLSPGGSTTGMEAVHPSELEAVVECETFECALGMSSARSGIGF
ncbi:hypothetical protein T484DRAFT_1855444 [Baffinella frigidus]|nr:hypothetical protein T484DRAFT_1855444 [Cryptophyta sp. CCMP2293]